MQTYANEPDEKADARLQDFCDLLNEIEKRPDAEALFTRAYLMMRVLVYGPEDAEVQMQIQRSEKPKPKKRRDYWPRELAC